MIGRMMTLALSLAMIAGIAQAETADVEGGKIYYEACGSGPKTLVLIHDGVIDSGGFDGIWPILCKDFRVVRYDRRGFGKSPPATAPYSAEDDLAAVLRIAKVQRASLVGFSFGGGLGVSYALDNPGQVESLVLAGPALSGFATTRNFSDSVGRVIAPIAAGNIELVIANALKETWIVAPGGPAAGTRLAAIVRSNPQDLSHQLRDPVMPRGSDLPRMAGLKAPTLILTGEYDIADNQAQAGAAQVLIPGAKRVVVENAGHLIQLDQPDRLAQLIGDFARSGQ